MNFPFFVVIRMTPMAPREPYIADEAASFNTSIDSISWGAMLFRLKLDVPSTIIPSITIRGCTLRLLLWCPLITNSGFAPASPLNFRTHNPDTRPCKPVMTLPTWDSCGLKSSTEAMEPVTLRFN